MTVTRLRLTCNKEITYEGRATMKKLAKKACAFTLFTMMTLSPLGLASAETPEAPVKPQAESYQDNDKIEEYNNQVDIYNEAVANYNLSVDVEYDNAVQEAAKANEEVAAHNAAEEQRIREAEARNEQAIKDAEEQNAKIDEENAAGLKAAQEAVEAQYASDVAQYEADVEQYNKDLTQYNKDLNIESQILGLGYASVEQYNEKINSYYNEPAKKSVEANANAKKLGISDTYQLQEAAVKSGRKIKVRIEHNFYNTDINYYEEFEIDANDIITVKALSAPAENTNPGYASFYYNTDDAHSMGYWMESDSYVATNANINDYGWDCGDTHTISFKDGKKHAFDIEDIEVIYNYMWMPLKTYKTYNVPKAPTAPTAPVKGEVSFEKAAYVEAQLEDIAEADIWNFVADPVKKAYLELLSHMDLFQVPDAPKAEDTVENTTPEIAPIAKNATSANNAEEAFAPALTELASIDEIAAPLAAKEEAAEATTVITDDATPKAEADGFWALINLIAAILTALMSIVLAVLGLKKKNEEENEEADNKVRFRLLGMFVAAISVIAFILTEDMALPMHLIDKWTIVMIILLAVETVLAIASRKTKKEEDEEEVELMAA